MSCSCRPLFFSGTSILTSNRNSSKQQLPLFGNSVIHLNKQRSIIPILTLTKANPYASFDFTLLNNNNNNNSNNNGPPPWRWWRWWSDDSNPNRSSDYVAWLICCFVALWLQSAASASARTTAAATDEDDSVVWEVKGSRWIKVVPDFVNDQFVVSKSSGHGLLLNGRSLWMQCKALVVRFLLPEGFPQSVTCDYLDYSIWRAVQGVASQISGVLATQALLYAVGLGKGAIPTAAAINWVLKDGIGYLSKIVLSKYGRHFDVHPKGWRLFADLLENLAFGLEILTPAFPHHFVFIGAAAGAGRSAAALIQAATRSCFYAGFAAQRNFAEVIAKGEAQGMVSKFIGIIFGIGLANCIGSSIPLALVSFSVVTSIHMFCNFKSYQSIQLRTLNPYRASLVFSEYLLSGQAPPIKEVNDEEPPLPALFLQLKSANKPHSTALSSEARDAAIEIERRLQLGSKLSEIVNSKDDVLALFNLYKDEGYILTEYKRRFCVVLKESCSAQDMLRALFQVNYLHWLERNMGLETRGISADCSSGGKLQVSLEYMQRELSHVRNDSISMGWVADGLIARPLPNRISPSL